MDENDTKTSSSPRGDATREALVTAAIELFGKLGYDGVGNRALAAAAGVNQALIGYHFGGKSGLYLAVFEHIAEQMKQRLGGPVAAAVEARLAEVRSGTVGREALLEALLMVVDRFVEVFASPETGPWAMLIVREQQNPSAAFDLVWERFLSRMLTLLTRLVAAHQGREEREEEVRLLVFTIVGQVLVFRVARAAALRHLGWEGIGGEEIPAIQQRIRRNVQAILQPEDPS